MGPRRLERSGSPLPRPRQARRPPLTNHPARRAARGRPGLRGDLRGDIGGRAGFVAASLLAFALYRVWPVAPPRLLSDGSGGTHLVDTLAAHPTPWDFQHGPMSEVANQYAAMPSMHAGWALFCALAFGLGRSRRVRRALLGYPLLTTLVIIATGNHFLLDAVAGFAVVGAGLAAATLGERLITALRATHSAPALTSA